MSNTTIATTLEEGLGRSGTELIVREICSLRGKIDDATTIASDNPFTKGTGVGSAVLRNSDSTASGDFSIAIGMGGTASGLNSYAEGGQTTASGSGSHAEGEATVASGYASHSEGSYTTASGRYSHAQGSTTTASGWYSHAEGYKVIAGGTGSHAEGILTKASDVCAHAEGNNTIASGGNSHAGGRYTIAKATSQTAIGEYNIQDDNDEFYLIVGNGNSTARNNAFTVSKSGEVMMADGLRVKEDSSSDEAVIKYDSTNKCLKFVFE